MHRGKSRENGTLDQKGRLDWVGVVSLAAVCFERCATSQKAAAKETRVSGNQDK